MARKAGSWPGRAAVLAEQAFGLGLLDAGCAAG